MLRHCAQHFMSYFKNVVHSLRLVGGGGDRTDFRLGLSIGLARNNLEIVGCSYTAVINDTARS